LFYLLKVRYQEHEVGSTYLWEQLVRDLAVHEPWQRPRFSVLLLIQALLLGGLALALARPAILTGGAERAYAVVLLDASASMNATDVPPSRFERARQLARQAIGDLPEGSTATLVLETAHPDVLVAETSDGAFDPPRIDTTGVKVSYTPVGGGDENRAIVAIDARPNPQNRGQYQAFVRVQNYAQ